MQTWYPPAVHDPQDDVGPFVAGAPDRGVLHTTESAHFPTYKPGTHPHFTVWLDAGGKVHVTQHVPIDHASAALVHAAGQIDTNREGAIQIEIAWYAAKITTAPRVLLEAVRQLMRWIETQTGIARRTVPFKPYPASYGAGNGVRMTVAEWKAFHGWCGHEHVPENCVHPDTLILCADAVWRRAGDLDVGDELVSFDEETVRVGNANGGRRYRRGVVTRNEPAVRPCMRVVTTQGEVIATSDHPWLVRIPTVKRGSRVHWVQTKDLDPARHRIVSVGDPWQPEDTRAAGWMAGVLDADGHAFAGGRHGSWVGFGQVDGAVLDLFLAECDRRGWVTKVIRRDWTQRRSLAEHPKPFTDVRINGGMWSSLRVLGTLRPERLLPAAERMWEGAVVGKTTGDVAVVRVEDVGDQPIASITVDAGTYIAAGLLCHNTHGDPGAINMTFLLGVDAKPIVHNPYPAPGVPFDCRSGRLHSKAHVEWLQWALGFTSGHGLDGELGEHTRAALLAFKKAHKLVADLVVRGDAMRLLAAVHR